MTAATGTKVPALATFISFKEFVEQLVLPQHTAHPAYDALLAGVRDPFIERPTPRGNSLDLTDALRFRSRQPGRKYFYIYEL